MMNAMDDGNHGPRPLPGLARLNRRRRRIRRNQRHYGGKTIVSWAEYSAVTLTRTGDTSQVNQWAYILIGTGGILLPFFLIAIAFVASEDNVSIWTRILHFAEVGLWFVVPILVFVAILLMGSAVQTYLDKAAAKRRAALKDQ